MKKNMGTIDRIIRVIIVIVIGILYFTKTISGTLGLILIILAIFFIFTSIFGTCPIYMLLGISTRKKDEK